MDRRAFLGVLGLLAVPRRSFAQAPPRIGLLSIGTDPVKPNPIWVQFLKQLEDLGYVEGRNLALERAFAGGQQERLGDLIARLAASHVDVVAATGDAEISRPSGVSRTRRSS